MKIGFVVNPIAGMGGKVGLKGTDNLLDEAIRRGAKPVSPEKAIEFLRGIDKKYEIYTASNDMGENECRKSGIHAKVVYKCNPPTTKNDTINACREFMRKNVDIIIFVGGDGTARDVYTAVGNSIPILGVPAGVKMYSGVFAFTPRDAADIVNNLNGFEEREIFDIDEDSFRKDKLKLRLIGYAIAPMHERVQQSKDITVNEGKEEIAEWIVENMERDTVYIIGGGSTTWEIKKALGIEGTFLGVDIVINGKIVCRDADEKSILKWANRKAKIIITPLGGHGFIFGRGNQQISSSVIKKVGINNIIVIATRDKLSRLDSLKVDTGDEELNEKLRGYMRIITGYNEAKIMRVI